MTSMTCPDHTCGYNGFGVCQMHIPAEALRSGLVTQHQCPYYRAAHRFLNQRLATRPEPTSGIMPFPGLNPLSGAGLAEPGQWYPNPEDNKSAPFGR